MAHKSLPVAPKSPGYLGGKVEVGPGWADAPHPGTPRICNSHPGEAVLIPAGLILLGFGS
jgi:hypothetical protein